MHAKDDFPNRKTLPHGVPSWVRSDSLYFITVCCQPRGFNQLCHPGIDEAVFESVTHRHQQGIWYARLVLLMPDHLHGLFAFAPDCQMKKTVNAWKGYLARFHGLKWQRDFFDHRIRDHESRQEKANYLRQNPVRAGLVKDANSWPYVWEPEP